MKTGKQATSGRVTLCVQCGGSGRVPCGCSFACRETKPCPGRH